MSDHLPGIASLGGSFDRDDHDNRSNDGLLGLQALRDRAHSSPGPLSSSPASASVHSYSTSPRNLVPQPPVRPRTVSRDGSRSQSTGGPSTRRPPLAGGSALSPSSSSALHHLAGGGAPSANSSGSSSRDASPPPNAGIIARPPESYSPYDGGRHHGPGGGGLDSSLRRALINERGSGGADGGFINDNKFHTGSPFSSPHPNGGSVGGGPSRGGNLPSSLQGGPGVFQPQQHRHQRSQSQPGPRMAPTDYYTGPQDNLGGYGGGDVTVHQHNRRSSDYGSGYHGGPNGGIDSEYGNHFNDGQYGAGGGHHPRSLSMQHSSNSYVSDPNFQEMNRRGSTVYYGGRGGGGRDRDYGGGYDDHYNFHRQDRLVSPAHSPHQASYGGHSRQSSMGTTLSSSPMSMSSRVSLLYCCSCVSALFSRILISFLSSSTQQQYGRRRDLGHGNSEEDLSHPLAGENIEVPGEDQYYNDMPAPYSRSHSMGAGPAYRGDSRHLGTSGMGLPPPIRAVYNVKFKRTQRPFEIGPRLTRDLKVGTYVKVEADRGEDLGIVVGLVKGTHRSSSFGGGMDELPTAGAAGMPHDQKKIIRLATHDEVALLQIKRDEEDELLRVCRMKVRQRGLPMNVVDAEYQFDRHKLTFFFEAEGRVDFRELVRDLFSIYKTRIWMQQLDKSISASCPVAPETDPLMMDQGTPIIAPAHEYEDFAASSVVPEDTYGGNHDYM